MLLRNHLTAIFLAALFCSPNQVLGLLPSASVQHRPLNIWGVTSSSSNKPLISQCRNTHLGVAFSSTSIDNAIDGEEEDDDSDKHASEEFILDDFEGGDDAADLNTLLQKKEQRMNDLRRCAKTTSRDPTAVGRAQEIFDEMFETYVTTEEASMWPAVDVYNLLIETHAYARTEDGGEEAERLLARMEDEANDFVARPNLETYKTVMDAWAMRKSPERSQGVVDRLQHRYEETGDESIKPTVDIMNKLIKSYGMAGEPEQAESIFRDLLHADENDDDDEMRANYKSWIQIMKCYASFPEGEEKVLDLFQEMQKAERMGETEYRPRTEAYNAKMKALSHHAGGVEEVEAMLFEMITKFREGEEDYRPNAESFRNVMTALRRLRAPNGAKIEHLLQIQDGLYGTYGNNDLKLDGRQYHVAMSVIARSRDSKKAIRVRRIVDKLKDSTDDDVQLSERAFFLLLSASAHTNGTPEENFEAFQIAVDSLKDLREFLGHEPDSSCFGMFLRACANLMPESQKRDGVVRSVFKKCCSEGYVNAFVLMEFERASTEALELELLGGFLEDDVRIPDEWSRNVK